MALRTQRLVSWPARGLAEPARTPRRSREHPGRCPPIVGCPLPNGWYRSSCSGWSTFCCSSCGCVCSTTRSSTAPTTMPQGNLGPVIGQGRINLRHDATARFEQNEPDLVAVDVLVQGCDSGGERGQLAEELHADQPAADNHEGELPAFPRGVRLDVGALEPFDDMVGSNRQSCVSAAWFAVLSARNTSLRGRAGFTPRSPARMLQRPCCTGAFPRWSTPTDRQSRSLRR